MQIYNTAQIHAWDEYTIRNEPVTSFLLMERAATACFEWIIANGYRDKSFSVYCGKGNNGGDGLAIARLLSRHGNPVTVYILEFGHLGTADFQQNLALLHESEATIIFISNEDNIRDVPAGNIIIDSLLGSGLNRELDGLTSTIVHHLNNSGLPVISIDLPTGLFADKSHSNTAVVRATHTLSFESYKLSFLFEENQEFLGAVHILDIGLHKNFVSENTADFHLIDHSLVKSIIRKRKKFSHKGDYGSGAIISGSTGMMGAAVLCARAFMRSGAGKLTCHIPGSGYSIMQSSIPEAMCRIEKGIGHIKSISALDKYDSVGIGPGIGLHDSHTAMLEDVFSRYSKSVVIDADALTILSKQPELLQKLPPLSILTPHNGEFERLFGKSQNDYERITRAIQKAADLNIIIVVKGPFTCIAMPGGKAYFNSTGNAGMATGGAGDVLTGILTGLLCQGYAPAHAAVAGVYLHGLAGNLAAAAVSEQSLIASDIINYLGQAFKTLE